MMKKITLLLFLSICVATSLWSQTSENFTKLDEKNSFKDVSFGTSLQKLRGIMKLKDPESGDNPNQYSINNPKYLSIGIYNATYGSAFFTNDKFTTVGLSLSKKYLTYSDYFFYFAGLFGLPNNMEKGYEDHKWTGKNIVIVLSDGEKYVSIMIMSKSTIEKEGSQNF